jgi:hypothetical protein
MADSIFFMDDNHIIGSPLGPTENSKVDHYAVDWIEVHPDGTYGAIISQRKIFCMWPEATVTGAVYPIGILKAASVSDSCSKFETPMGCVGCELSENWCRYRVTLNYEELAKCQSFGGLQWEAMKFIASKKNEMTQNGFFTGPTGNRATFSTSFRLPSMSVSLNELTASGTMNVQTNGQFEPEVYEVEKTLTDLSVAIRSSSLPNFDLSAVKADRAGRLATPRKHEDDLSKCCSKVDFEFLGGRCCDQLCGAEGKCCPDDFDCVNGKCVTKKYYCKKP